MGVSCSSRAGLRDWVIQRVSAVIVLAYFIFVGVFLFTNHSVLQWRQLFAHQWMKVLSLIALVSISWHAWIGLWTVLTDYVHNKKIQSVLLLLILAVILFFIADLVYILWF